jgi:hypothetical protein
MDRVERRELSLGLFPWAVFAVVGRNAGQGAAWASVAGLVTVLVVAFPGRAGHKLKHLERCALTLFSLLFVAGLVAGPDQQAFVNQNARALAFGGLALVAITSLFFVPFTEEYARDAVRRRYWNTPRFVRVNFRISALGAVAFSAMTVSFVLGQAFTTPVANTVLNWVVPIAIGFSATMLAREWWTEYFDSHVPAADETRSQMNVLDTLFLDDDRRAG